MHIIFKPSDLNTFYKIKIRCLECDLFRSVLDYLGSNLNIWLSFMLFRMRLYIDVCTTHT